MSFFPLRLHPENAEPGLLDRRVERRGDRQPERAPCLLGRDDAVVPEARCREVGIALALVLLEDGAFELLLLLLAPGAAFRLDAVPLHAGEDRSRLLPPHHP